MTVHSIISCITLLTVAYISFYMGVQLPHSLASIFPLRQTICTSLKTDNNTKTHTPSLNFYMPDGLPAAQATVSKH